MSSNDCRSRRTGTPAQHASGEQRSPSHLDETDVAELFAQYQCWLRRGDFPAAIAALERACDGADDAACPFNRALVHHAWLAEPGELDPQHCSIARRNYASYLAREPYEEQSDAARSALAELDRICAPEPPAKVSSEDITSDAIPALQDGLPPPPMTMAPPPSVSRGAHPPSLPPETLVPQLLIGAGSACAVATAVAWIDMTRADADLMHHVQSDGSIYPNVETRARDASRRRYQNLVWGLGGSAALLLGAGLTLLWIEPEELPVLNVSMAPGAAELTIDGDF